MQDVDLVVIHCTELPDLATARKWGEKIIYPESLTGNSGHYYIDRDGHIEQWVPLDRVAHHVRSFNRHSVGIELVNNGRYPNWFDSRHQHMSEQYPRVQIQSLLALLEDLSESIPGLKSIAGHADLDEEMIPSDDRPDIMVRRKLDPGPQFPWADTLKNTRLERKAVEDA
jgi:N-acetylmuramoyl-L-alanine amidase